MATEQLLVCQHPLDIGGRPTISGRVCEMSAVVSQHGVDAVWNGFDQAAQEIAGYPPGSSFMQFGKGEFARAVDGHKHVELALVGPDLGNVYVEVANRVRPELLPGLCAFHIRQSADVMTLKEPVK